VGLWRKQFDGGKPVQESSREFKPTPSSLVAQKA